MEIIRGKPIARGVTELMYVGDDDEIEAATRKGSPIVKLGLLALAVYLLARAS